MDVIGVKQKGGHEAIKIALDVVDNAKNARFGVRQHAEGKCFSSWTRYNHRFFSVEDGNFYAIRKFEIGTIWKIRS